ncbi:hypothetical protein [Silvibacterium sp.]|uniref:hypothetical protein n=1 Tax=Silvibacterium sp. TaxID=1964179 RepID=UPI0039E4E507
MTYQDPNPPQPNPCPQPETCPPQPFRLEAVVVCDQYSDFLAHTLPHNKFLFDRIVVITSYEDRATRKLCEFHHVQCIPTDLLQSRKGEFHKGKGINLGLAALSLKGWAVHLDADIYLPPQTRLLLQQAELDPRCVYGIDRFNVRGYPAWAAFQGEPRLQQEAETYIHMHAFPIGTRVMHRHAGGYVPIGFFQLWNPSVSGITRYPEEHTNAGRGDTVFAQLWPRARRGFIPEIVGYHLESDDARNAANWNGRITAPFTHA